MITCIQIEGLFGRFDYTIAQKHGGITIITGPNGFGKSTILRMIDALSRGAFAFFYELDFGKLVVFQAFYDALKGKKGQTINVAGIFKSLLCSYGEICFSETKLYQKLTAYQDMHRVIIVKSPNYYNS